MCTKVFPVPLSKNFEEGVEVKEARGRVMPYGAHTVPAIP